MDPRQASDSWHKKSVKPHFATAPKAKQAISLESDHNGSLLHCTATFFFFEGRGGGGGGGGSVKDCFYKTEVL